MHIADVFCFFLPAGIANMAPVLFKWLPPSTPLDFNERLHGQPILGPNKTWRGLLSGVLGAILVVWLERATELHSSVVDYQTVSVWALGAGLGFGALAGDALKSFFKRRLRIRPGKSWVPFDQLDWVVGAAVVSSLVVPLSFINYALAAVIFGLLHPIGSLAGYSLGLKKDKL